MGGDAIIKYGTTTLRMMSLTSLVLIPRINDLANPQRLGDDVQRPNPEPRGLGDEVISNSQKRVPGQPHCPKAVDATQLASKASQQPPQVTGGDATEHAQDHYAEDDVS